MIILDDKHLLMIEPKRSEIVALGDELTSLAERVFAAAASDNIHYRGWHTCVCGKKSDNNNWILPTGHITNSLMVHYIACHRDEVPESEIAKLRRIAATL